MKTVLEKYLFLLTEDIKMDNIMSNKKVIIYNTPNDIKKGLLRFEKPPINNIFLFILPEEDIVEFTTIGMKFPIKIFFFNSKRECVYSAGIIKPDVESINSRKPCKYVIEIPINDEIK